MTRPRRPADVPGEWTTDPAPVRDGETFITYTDPMTLAPVHPLRKSHCLTCREMVGGRPVRFLQIVIAADVACQCENLATISQIVCASHGEPDAKPVVAAAIRHLAGVHGTGRAHGMGASR